MSSGSKPGLRPVAPLKDGDRTVVIGGGPAGLTAAYLLAKQGYPVTVIERDSIVGGIARTAQYKGYRFDIGGHRFFTKISAVEQLWEELAGPEMISVPRLSRIHYGGKYFDYPLKPMNALRGLGLINAIRIAWGYVEARMNPHIVEENFEQWVCNRFGRRLYEIFFKTYTEKVWGIPCTEIRAEWAAQRIKGLSLARAILTATALNRRDYAIKSLIEEFRYPRLGPGQMWEICTDRIRQLGGEVLMRHRAQGIETTIDANGARLATGVTVSTDDGARRTLPAQHVISSMPVSTLTRVIEPQAPDAVREAAAGLRYRDFVLVALILNGEDFFPDNWIYVHTPGVQVGRVQNFNNWSRAMVPDPGRTCLGMEYFCFRGDGLMETDDAALIAKASKELEQLGLAKASDVVDGAVVRMPKAYPIYDGAYRAHLNDVRAFLDPIANLHTIGRNGMHKYNNQDHSMLTAMMTVWNMLGGRHDVWTANTDYEYHEEQQLPTAPPRGSPA